MTDNRANGDKSNTLTLLEFSKAIGAKETLLSLEDVTYILDLINRLKADNEELKKQLDDKCDRCIAREKSEALKEFAERLKEEMRKYCGDITEDDIDNILKEMAGDT